MAPDMTWKGSIRCFIIFFTRKLVILHITDITDRRKQDRVKKTKQKNNTQSGTKKRQKAKSKSGHLINFFCLFVCFIIN